MTKAERESFWECVRIVAQRVADRRTPQLVTTRARAMQVLDQLDAMKAADESRD